MWYIPRMSVRNPVEHSGKVVIVTGGCRGVGRGIAERYLAFGADVVIFCRHEPERLPVADGREAAFVAADIRDPDEIDKVAQFTVDHFGRLDVLVNNAGGSPPADSATASPKFSNAIVNLNLMAPLLFSQRANAIMQTQDTGGVIVNIASVSGIRPSPGTVAYGAAKAGLISMTKTLAVDFAPKVRVVCLTAGLVRTEQSHLFYGDDEGIAAIGATIPLRRMADPEDIGDVCVFLSSSMARYISGASILVDGGGERPAYLDASTADSSPR